MQIHQVSEAVKIADNIVHGLEDVTSVDVFIAPFHSIRKFRI